MSDYSISDIKEKYITEERVYSNEKGNEFLFKYCPHIVVLDKKGKFYDIDYEKGFSCKDNKDLPEEIRSIIYSYYHDCCDIFDLITVYNKFLESKEGAKIISQLFAKDPEGTKDFISMLLSSTYDLQCLYSNGFYKAKLKEIKKIKKSIQNLLKEQANLDGTLNFDIESAVGLIPNELYRNLDNLTISLNKREGELQNSLIEELKNQQNIESQKIEPPIFWMRVVSDIIRSSYNKPKHEYVAQIINLIFDKNYSYLDVINYTKSR